MKKQLQILATAGLMLSTLFLSAQTRYFDEVFTSVNVSSDVKYGENYNVYISPPTPTLQNLVMDVYEPAGDTITERPLIILAHAGSFLPKCVQNTLPLGDKKDSCMVEMCTQFAKRGFVAVSMDYRLGWNPLGNADERAGSIMTAVYLALLDMKACVRYMKVNSSTYGIDTTKVVVGGSNSGGYVALAYGALNQTSELGLLKFLHSSTGNPYVNQGVWGDFEGDNGTTGFFKYNNPGASSTVNLVLNLGGAIGDTSWQEGGEVPIISFHGEADSLTPIGTKVVRVAATGQPVVEVSGSRDLSRYAQALGNQNFYDAGFTDDYTVSANSKTTYSGFMPFFGPANGYEPWAWYDGASPCIAPGSGTGSAANPLATKAKALAYIDTIMGFFVPRAVNVLLLPGNTVGIDSPEELSRTISMYPNPSSDVVTISSANARIQNIVVYDLNGRQVKSDYTVNPSGTSLDVSTLNKGVYFVRMITDKGTVSKKLLID